MATAPPRGAGLRRWLIRAGGSAAILLVLFWLLPLGSVLATLRAIPAGTFAAVLCGFLAVHALAAAKWWWLLDRRLPLGLALRAHLAGLAANLCLPGSIGGDAVRAGVAQVELRDLPRVAAAGAVDRLVDLLALALLSLAGLALARDGRAGAGLAVETTLALGLVILLVALLPRLLPLVWRIAPGLPGRGAAERLAGSLGEIGRRPGRLLLVLLLSMALQAVLLALAWWLATAAGGVGTGFGPWLFAWPLAKVASVLPVSLNGLGLREGVLAALLHPFGADPATVVAAGLAWQAVLFAAGAVGALVYGLSARLRRAPGPQPAE